MNSPQNLVAESHLEAQAAAPAVISPARRFYWAIRREIWENRSVYLVPLIAAVLFLFGIVINVIMLRRRMRGALSFDITGPLGILATPNEVAAGVIMGVELIVGVFYSIDALYGERRDRSILFWKSLPVSDVTTVLSKFAVPLVVLPLLAFGITVVTQFIMLLLTSLAVLGTGHSVATLWTQASFLRVALTFLYHIVTVHGLWYAPIYGWLLMVSAWSRRAPFLWAFLPPFVICGVEKVAFNTSYFLNMLQVRLEGPNAVPSPPATGHASMEVMAILVPHNFFIEPGLWIGLGVAAIFLAVAVRLRRYRGPI